MQLILKNDRIQINQKWLTDDSQTCWDLIKTDADNFQLQETEDKVIWKLGKSNNFSMKSLYNAMTKTTDADLLIKESGKGKCLQKSKILYG